MRPIRVAVSGGVGASNPVPLDHYIGPFNVGLGVVVSGTLTYTVQHTFDDIHADGFDPDTATWFDNAGLTNQTATNDGNYAFPVTAVRLNVSAYTSGTAVMTVVQAGKTGGK